MGLNIIHHNRAITEPGPATEAEAVTPDDSTIQYWRSLYVADGGAGKDVTVVPIAGSDPVTFADVPIGTILPIAVKKVMATGTTSTDIVGMI